MKYTIKYDREWNIYIIELQDTNGNIITFDYYKELEKIHTTHLKLANSNKTCSGKILKANNTILSSNEYQIIRDFKLYFKENQGAILKDIEHKIKT